MQLSNSETVLETNRLFLEPLKQHHATQLYSLLQDERIYTYIPQDPPLSLEVLKQRYQKLERRLSPDSDQVWLNWAVYIQESKTYAGYIEATVLPDRSAGIAYILAPMFWRQGYAREACEQILNVLSKDYGILMVTAEVDTRNTASVRLLEHLGFMYVETRKDADFFKNSSSDEYVYQLTVFP
jgi:[ribosomal protein S5]-alanine N-acetyltransferase